MEFLALTDVFGVLISKVVKEFLCDDDTSRMTSELFDSLSLEEEDEDKDFFWLNGGK